MKRKNRLFCGLGIGILAAGGSVLTLQAEDTPYAIISQGLSNVTYSDVLEYGDEYVLLVNRESGFSSTTKQYGIYDIINQKWCMEYEDFSEVSLDKVEYAGDGMFILTDANHDRYEAVNGLYNMDMTRPLLFLDAKSGESFYADMPQAEKEDPLDFKDGYSINLAQAEDWDIYVTGEDGSCYPTGIAEYCMELDEDNELSDDNIRRCYVDEDYAVYAYNEEYFILYDRQKDEITDFYDPVYAGKMAYLDTDVYVCGDYLAFTNLRGEDKENYYAVLTLDGEEYIAPEKCDDSMVTERGNLLVRTGDQLQEIGLENRTPENALAVDQLAKAYKAESSRIAYELGMDRKGTIYENVITYMDDMGRDTSNNVADTWYLGGNYGTFQGTWYYPYDTKDDGVGMLQLIGDGRVIYESPVLNAQNCQVDFAVDVSGIQQLRMEYSGVAGLDKKLVGLAGGIFLSSGSILDVSAEPSEKTPAEDVIITPQEDSAQTDASAEEVLPVMLYDLYAYQGDFHKEEVVTDNMGNDYYKAIRVYATERKASYDIEGKYHTLSGIVAVTKGDQDTDTDRNKRGHIRVYGDDRLLWEDADLNTMTRPYEMSVDISGVQDLRIEMQGFDARLMSSGINVIFENAVLQ